MSEQTTDELTRLRDRHQRMLIDRERWRESVYAAARREALREVEHSRDRRIAAAVSESLRPITGLIYRVGQLGDRAGTAQVAALKAAATEADRAVRTTSRTASDDPDAERLRKEITRLRGVITASARHMHEAVGTSWTGCRCPGCDLIVAMDTQDLPRPVDPLGET